MKNQLQLGISIIVILLVILFINLQPKKKPIDWEPTFSHTHKKPFGTYVLFNELDEWIPEEDIQVISHETFITEMGSTADTSLFNRDSSAVNLVLVHPNFNIYTLESQKLLDFIQEGNSLFLSTIDIPLYFIRELDSNLIVKYNFRGSNVHVKTEKNSALIFEKGRFENSFYDSLETYETYSSVKHSSEDFYSSFMKIPYGKGQIIIHNFPYALSNYYLLHDKEDYRTYATDVLNTIPKQKTYWVEPFNEDDLPVASTKDLFSVISQLPQLFSAWKLLLVSLLLYAIFKAKREQRLIPIIPELKNHSKDYIKVISNLYHREEDYVNLTHKKHLILIDQLKTKYHLDLTEDTDPQTIINKTQSSENDVKRLLKLIKLYQKEEKFTEQQFIEFCKLSDRITK